jgi:hypothetical protein
VRGARLEPAQRGHVRLQGQRRGGEALGDEAQAGGHDELARAGAGEEAQVGAVEQAVVGVGEAAPEQRPAAGPVGDVRDADDGPPARPQERGEERERRPRVAQVLEHVAGDDGVEGRADGERGPAARRLDVAGHHLRAGPAGPGRRGGGGVGLDSDDRAAARGELGREVARGAADVEHARTRRHRVDEQPVRGREAVGGDERRVRAGAHSPQSVASSARDPPRSRCSQR